MSQEIAQTYLKLNDAESAATNIEKLLDSLDAKIDRLSEEIENISNDKDIDHAQLASKNEELKRMFEMTSKLQNEVSLQEEILEKEQ